MRDKRQRTEVLCDILKSIYYDRMIISRITLKSHSNHEIVSTHIKALYKHGYIDRHGIDNDIFRISPGYLVTTKGKALLLELNKFNDKIDRIFDT